MPVVRVGPDDPALIKVLVGLENASTAVDDPEAFPMVEALVSGNLRYGWELDPGETFLYYPDGADTAVGSLEIHLPRHDNLHLVWAGITVHPDHRRQGHGTAMFAEVLRRTRAAGRSTIWLGSPEDDLGVRAVIEKMGFHWASHDARRRQVLAQVDSEAVDRLYEQARVAAADYVLERAVAPVSDELLEELLDVTAAINDAPMGDLTYEEEKYDLPRLRDAQTAATQRGDTIYRLWARHRDSGEIGGHTVVGLHPLRPEYGGQGDTAVARKHRGHRLGLLLKIEMMRWLAEVEPQLETIDTFNQADNDFMINVNEAIGYRLSRVFAIYERTLPAD
jgi:RimJ/RimL family protein N-acetyltransferase